MDKRDGDGGGMDFAACAERSGSKRVLLWLGFGLFIVTYGGGPLGFVSGPTQDVPAWDSILLVQTAFMLGTALGCFGMKLVVRRTPSKRVHVLGAVVYVSATLMCWAAQPALAAVDVQTGTAVRSVLSLFVGALYAQPLVFWIEQFLDLSKASKRLGFIAAFVPCYALSPVVMASVSRFDGVPYVYSLLMAVCAIASALIMSALFHPSAPPVRRVDEGARSYRLTVHSVSVLVCLGFSWGIAQAGSLLVFGGGWSTETVFSMLVAFGLLFVIAVAMQVGRTQNSMRFGAFIRLSIVACGAVLVAAPLVFEFAPSLFYPLCNAVMMVGEISLIVFSIDICSEEGETLTNVFAANYATFIGAVCVSGALFWLAHTMIGGFEAWWLTAVASTWVVLAVIPFLPSRSSDAVVFTLSTLPENEGYEANISLQRERMTKRYGLSAGEAEVLGHLLQGMNREQIAAELYLSPWTIKSRISAIYKKCGIHSYKELVKLVSDDEA